MSETNGRNSAKRTVAQQRSYLVTTVAQAKTITTNWLKGIDLDQAVSLGLPEVDDRYHVWRVPLRKVRTQRKIGELVIDAYTTEILQEKTTKPELLESRLLGKRDEAVEKSKASERVYKLSELRNTVGYGDAEKLVEEMPAASVDLIFTSPPYFNARPEYSEFEEYDEYLQKMRQVTNV